jgi:hemerythrin
METQFDTEKRDFCISILNKKVEILANRRTKINKEVTYFLKLKRAKKTHFNEPLYFANSSI